MRSVLHELSRIREGGREYVSPMSEEEEEKEEEEENIPQSKQGKSIFARQQHMHCLFSFSLSLLFSFVCERNKKVIN